MNGRRNFPERLRVQHGHHRQCPPGKPSIDNAEKGLDHVARVYPQADLGAYYGSQKWMHWAWRTIGRTGMIDLGSDDTFHTIQGQSGRYPLQRQ